MLNNLNNPLGKVYTKKELAQLADFCIKNNIICISDEVYEHLVYKPLKHIRYEQKYKNYTVTVLQYVSN